MTRSSGIETQGEYCIYINIQIGDNGSTSLISSRKKQEEKQEKKTRTKGDEVEREND